MDNEKMDILIIDDGGGYLKNSLLEQPEHEVELLEEKVTENAAYAH